MLKSITSIFNYFNRQQQDDLIYNVRLRTGFPKCNYNCPYCGVGHGIQMVEGNTIPTAPLPLKSWQDERFERIVENVRQQPFNMNIRPGVRGEIFLSKLLLQNMKYLAQADNVRSINITTNLSFSISQYEKALADVNPKKWAFVASFHPTDIKDVEKWTETALYMNEHYDFAIALVAWPPFLAKLEEYKQQFEAIGLSCFVLAFQGEHNGKHYPHGYTDEEREQLKRLFYSRHDYELLVELQKPGKCNAGYRSFTVTPSGIVIPCHGLKIWSEKDYLGNFAESPVLNLANAARDCPFNDCTCDTENMNLLSFKNHYVMTGINQHKYAYKSNQQDEWTIAYP